MTCRACDFDSFVNVQGIEITQEEHFLVWWGDGCWNLKWIAVRMPQRTDQGTTMSSHVWLKAWSLLMMTRPSQASEAMLRHFCLLFRWARFLGKVCVCSSKAGALCLTRK